MPIGQGSYGRGGLIGGAKRAAQRGDEIGAYKYKAQDARGYLSAQNRSKYDANVSYLSGGPGAAPGARSDMTASQLLRERNFYGAPPQLQALRKKATEAIRMGGSLRQGEGQAKPGRGRVDIPEEGSLLTQLKIDAPWQGTGKPWLFKDDTPFGV